MRSLKNTCLHLGRLALLSLPLWAGQAAQAAPQANISFTSNTATVLQGTFAGLISDIGFSLVNTNAPIVGGFVDVYTRSVQVMSPETNWDVTGFVYKAVLKDADLNATGEIEWGVSLSGVHLVAPHAGETAPNTNNLSTWYYGLAGHNLGSQLADDVAHDSHIDTLSLTINDMNGVSAGFLGSGNALSASFTFTHTVPEPAESALMLAGLAALVAARRRR